MMVPYLTSMRNDTALLLLLSDISWNKPSQIRGIKPTSPWYIEKMLHLEPLLQNHYTYCTLK